LLSATEANVAILDFATAVAILDFADPCALIYQSLGTVLIASCLKTLRSIYI